MNWYHFGCNISDADEMIDDLFVHYSNSRKTAFPALMTALHCESIAAHPASQQCLHTALRAVASLSMLGGSKIPESTPR